MQAVERLVAAVLAVLSFVPDSGGASQYDPHVMSRVVTNRQAYGQLPADLPPVAGYIAVVDCGRLGEVWLVRPDGGAWEALLVVDCSGHAETTAWMEDNNILMEVGHPTAIRWGAVGVGIQVDVFRPP